MYLGLLGVASLTILSLSAVRGDSFPLRVLLAASVAVAATETPCIRQRLKEKMRLIVLIAVGLLASVPATASGAPRGKVLTRGVLDEGAMRYGSDAERAHGLALAYSSGIRWVRVDVRWANVAPAGDTKPAGFDAADPGDPRYRWGEVDRTISELRAAGLEPLVTVTFAPRWAEGPGRPRDTARSRPGTWKPSPRELELFMRAAARRYSGSYGGLPGVSWWQIWNEPNLYVFLRPQWVRRRPYAPRHYARMLSAAHRAVKSVGGFRVVVSAGTAPFGGGPRVAHGRVAPVRFVREMLRFRPPFDVLAHHPYSIGGPTRRALNRDDASLPDIWKLRRELDRVRTRRPRAIFVTEMGWDTRPPDPEGIPLRTHARWMSQALYVLWRQGVTVALNLHLVDAPLGEARPGAPLRQAGLFLLGDSLFNARPKPARTAFRFPFAVDGQLAWGVSPCTCRITIERRVGSGWRRVALLRRRAERVFTVRVRGNGPFRARAGSTRSLSLRPARL